MRSWDDQGIAPELIAVNVSASQFKNGSSLDQFFARTLERLRQLGVRIAIDDFGTGYSSLSYLTNYPVSRLKIAQELVFGVIKDSRSATVVRAAIRLADELGIECIAEGVETTEQVKFLVAAGCAFGQGYLFDRPLSAERMTALLREKAARRPWPQLVRAAR